jgi:hypothetical protein
MWITCNKNQLQSITQIRSWRALQNVPNGHFGYVNSAPASYLEVPGSILSPLADYPDRFLCSFPQFMWANAGEVFKIGHDHFHIIFIIHSHSPIQCYITYTVQKVLLNEQGTTKMVHQWRDG